MTPSVRVLRTLRLRAIEFGRYPSREATLATRARVGALTSSDPFSALDTVLGATPATRAMSLSVTLLPVVIAAELRSMAIGP
jgi:hypothetical protein